MLSIIIVNYKTPKLLLQCIDSLQRTIQKTSYEIIVVDSESTGETPTTLKQKSPHVQCIPFRENTGYAKGVNAGIRRSRGDYFLILNADIIAAESAVDAMVRFLQSEGHGQGVGLLGPKLCNQDGTFQHSAFRFSTPLTIMLRRTLLGRLRIFQKRLDWFLMNDKHLETATKITHVDWMRGGALLASREAVKKVGLMDERFFMYFEDVDWARRFWENGYTVAYFPRSVMYHSYARTSHRFGVLDLFFNKMTWWHIKSAWLYFVKYRFKTVHYA